MKLSELVHIVGDENIDVQSIEDSVIRMKASDRYDDLEITFASPHDILNGANKVGLVFWFDKDKFKEALNEK